MADYLSDGHCNDRANGYALAALGANLARQSDVARRRFTTNLRAQLDRFTPLLRGGTQASRRQPAIATLSGIVGALKLARAVGDPALTREILAAARDVFGRSREDD